MTTQKRSPALTLSILLSVLITFAPRAGGAFKYLHEGMQAPSVAGKDISTGESVSIESALKDSVVLVVFWASWSERSLEQLKDMKRFAEEYSNQPFSLIGVNVEGVSVSAATRERLKDIVADLELPFPVIIDEGLDIFYKFGVIAVPSTALLANNGVLRFGPAGYSFTTRDRIVDSIETLLGLRTPSEETPIAEGYTPNNVASRYYQLARNLRIRGMYERALANVAQAIEADTLFPAPHSLKGEALLELDSLEPALASFKRAVALDSNSLTGWTGVGEAHLRLNHLDSAETALSRSLAIDSLFTPALLNYALCLAEKGDKEGAMLFIQRAVELNAKDPTALYYQGLILETNGDTTGAIKSFVEGLRTLYPAH